MGFAVCEVCGAKKRLFLGPVPRYLCIREADHTRRDPRRRYTQPSKGKTPAGNAGPASPRPRASLRGRAKRLPGARQGDPRALQAGEDIPRSRLAAPETSPGARMVQTASHQRGTSAGLAAARAPGGPRTISYGGRP